jgi:ABC-2 type transport system ATP-binding protein
VRDVSFRVESGQILGLVGPNGAGKTTTIRAITGIIPPTQGRLSVAGFDIVEDAVEAKRRLAYIPDDPKLFDLLTVSEHLQFTAQAYDVRADVAAERSENLLEQFELVAKRETPAQELSRGMRQKVAICCAYLHAPEAILFDEPLTGLDPRAIRTLKNSILERAAGGAGVLISSHLLSLVEDLCTHLLILSHGECRFFGPLEDLRPTFSEVSADASLEDLFFHITDGRTTDVAPSPTDAVLADDGAP